MSMVTTDPMSVLRADLAKAKGYWGKLAEDTGVDHGTICRIARSTTPNPQIDTFQKLRTWLDSNLPHIAALSTRGGANGRNSEAAA